MMSADDAMHDRGRRFIDGVAASKGIWPAFCTPFAEASAQLPDRRLASLSLADRALT